ncbi:aldose 1-epimerase [Paucibacter sp. R3-3]|uniref:Aldose 1-epimerase n=1 Tax=Roseateles agri TaxID=3098619 RepID=A0ABU5DHF5_9BURK|nr:aldose 1-epimerase [Paucibacter sp. R3-3]MDY0745720.1 aldose 1-epimerase [Paucibacter sp. R3-3]
MEAIELKAGELRMTLQPALGGSIGGLWRAGLPVLTTGPRGSACFPLVPYSNRLGDRRFRWQGVDHTTAPNFDGSPHSLHGVGWLREWSVTAIDEDAATLSYIHRPDEHWPFAFVAEQRFELSAGALAMTLRLTNTDHREQPAGLGWHPYFPRRERSHLRMSLAERWEADARQIPTHPVALDGMDAAVAELAWDHCFTGWRGAALIEDECMRLRLTSTLGRAVVFTPPGRDFFCVEPVSHLNDAIHQADPLAHGLVALAPGASLAASMRLDIA